MSCIRLFYVPWSAEICGHTLGIYPFFTAFNPYLTLLRVLYDFHILTRQFCNFCRKFVPVPGYGVCLSYPYPGRSTTSIQHTLPERFCEFCTTFIPLPDSSVNSVTTSYRYRGMEYAFHTRTRRSSATSVQHHTLPKTFCEFYTTSIPLPDSSVTSVTNLIPYRKYPYPTEHNLGNIIFFFSSGRGGYVLYMCFRSERRFFLRLIHSRASPQWLNTQK